MGYERVTGTTRPDYAECEVADCTNRAALAIWLARDPTRAVLFCINRLHAGAAKQKLVGFCTEEEVYEGLASGTIGTYDLMLDAFLRAKAKAEQDARDRQATDASLANHPAVTTRSLPFPDEDDLEQDFTLDLYVSIPVFGRRKVHGPQLAREILSRLQVQIHDNVLVEMIVDGESVAVVNKERITNDDGANIWRHSPHINPDPVEGPVEE